MALDRTEPIRSAGFTLTELMVALAIAAITATVAMPALQGFAGRTRVKTAATELHLDLLFARAEAARRSRPVAICASRTLTECTAPNDWATGYLIFQDTDGNGAAGSAEPVLRVRQQSARLTVAASGRAALGSIVFTPGGATATEAALVVCDAGLPRADAPDGRRLHVSRLGRARIEAVRC